jgi:Flp pilus assembly protein TadG
MSDTRIAVHIRAAGQRRQRGATAVEFSLISILFFTVLFGVIEFARLMFVVNTLAEVTRRAASTAASVDFSNGATMNQVQWQAIFRSSPGGMAVMNELTDQSVRIDYMAVIRNSDGTFNMTPIAAGSLPLSPADNRRTCLVDPNGSSCIRVVRARVCDPISADQCEPMRFKPLLPFVGISIALPTSPTLIKARSFGL